MDKFNKKTIKVHQKHAKLLAGLFDEKQIKKIFADAADGGATPTDLMAISYTMQSELSTIISQCFIAVRINQALKAEK